MALFDPHSVMCKTIGEGTGVCVSVCVDLDKCGGVCVCVCASILTRACEFTSARSQEECNGVFQIEFASKRHPTA